MAADGAPEAPRPVVYVTALAPVVTATAVVALGLVELLASRGRRVGVLGPIVRETKDDPLAELLVAHAGAGQDVAGTVVATSSEGACAEAVHGRVSERLAALPRAYDAVVCVGAAVGGEVAAARLELDTTVPAALRLPVAHVVEVDGRPTSAVVAAAAQERELLVARGCRLLATFVVGVAAGDRVDVRWRVGESAPGIPVYAVGAPAALTTPTARDAGAAIGATRVAGDEESMDRAVEGCVPATGETDQVLASLREHALLVAPAGRTDVALLAAAAVSARGVPAPGALVLSGQRPSVDVLHLLEPAGVPVLLTGMGVDDVVRATHHLRAALWPADERAVASSLGEFDAGVDGDVVAERLGLPPVAPGPRAFAAQLRRRARSTRKHAVLADGCDERVLRAAQVLVHGQLADVTLLGPADGVRRAAERLGIRLGDARIVDPLTSSLRPRLADAYVRLRSADGVSAEAAGEAAADPTCFGALYVQQGLADALLTGAGHAFEHTVRTALEVVRPASGGGASSAFVVCQPDRVVLLADCGVVATPSAEQLADVAVRSADTATMLGVEPRVALLSFSAGAASAGADIDRVRAAAELVAARRPDLPLTGPIQYDVAVVPSVAAARMPEDPVAGRASVLVFPDAKTAAATLRAMQRATGAVAIGPLLQGLQRPVNHVPREATVADIVTLVAATVLQSSASTPVRSIRI